MKKGISIWKIAFLVFLMIGTIYIIRNKQEEQTAKNWNKIDEKGQAYSSVSIEKAYGNEAVRTFPFAPFAPYSVFIYCLEFEICCIELVCLCFGNECKCGNQCK